MTKASLIAILSLVICISSSLNFAYGKAKKAKNSKFVVIGHVYCDTCRVEFETKLSDPIKGAVVKLECKSRTDGSNTYTSDAIETDDKGNYKIQVEGDYEDSDCDVALVKSPRNDCNDPTEEWRKARVVLTTLDGVDGENRYANNLGFKKKEALPGCDKVLKEMGYFDILRDQAGQPTASPSTKAKL